MSVYKRFISYVYNYENETKKNNIGYVRTEIRGNQYRLLIHAKTLSTPNAICQTYIYIRENEKIYGIYLGDIKIQNGMADGRITLTDTDIMDYNITFDKICGVILYLSPEKYFACTWDNRDINMHSFTEWKKEKEFKESVKEPEPQKTEAADTELQKPENDVPDINILKSEKTRLQAEKEIKDWESEQLEITEEPVLSEPDDVCQNHIWEDIFDKYPALYPFEDDEMEKCVGITPEDIKNLPEEYISLYYNNFLLHAFNSYRHLLLIKKSNLQSCEYLIGVPGIFRQRECFIAKMFGFTQFKSSRNRGIRPGEFGYWYLCLCEEHTC